MLPTPMLSRPGPIPTGRGWTFEVKWDGFRALVSTVEGVRVRSRRGWDMTALLLELGSLPAGSITETLDRYGHLLPGNEEKAADLLEAFLDAAEGGV